MKGCVARLNCELITRLNNDWPHVNASMWVLMHLYTYTACWQCLDSSAPQLGELPEADLETHVQESSCVLTYCSTSVLTVKALCILYSAFRVCSHVTVTDQPLNCRCCCWSQDNARALTIVDRSI